MPRKKKLEKPPLEQFTVDGVLVEVRDETCWPIGRGQHRSSEHYTERGKLIYEHITNMLPKNKNLNETREVFVKTVMEIFESPTSFVNAISEWGLFGEEGADPTDARKVWYPRYKKEFFAYIHAIEEDEKVRLPPTPE